MYYDLTISIVTYNTNREELLKVLQCLEKVKLNKKIFISDNSENQDIKKIVEELNNNQIEYIFNNSNRGFGAGHNIIINKLLNKELNSRYHLVMNSDVYFKENTVEKLLDYMSNHEKIGQIGPKITGEDGTLTYSCKLFPTPLNLIMRRFIPLKKIVEKMDYDYEMKWYNYKDIVEGALLSGCFMLLKTEVFEKVGKFDEKYFMYLEDYDFCRRIGEKYDVIYYPEVEITHKHAKSSYKSRKMLLIHIKSALTYFNKWGWMFDKKRSEKNKKLKKIYKQLGEKYE